MNPVIFQMLKLEAEGPIEGHLASQWQSWSISTYYGDIRAVIHVTGSSLLWAHTKMTFPCLWK